GRFFRQRLPLASRPQDVENSIQHLAHVHRPFAPTMSRWRDHGLYDRPFGIGQITGVTKATAVRRKAVFRCPHRALLKRESSARQGITSDSSDSRTSRISSKRAPPKSFFNSIGQKASRRRSKLPQTRNGDEVSLYLRFGHLHY